MNEQAATEQVTSLYDDLYPALVRYAVRASGRLDIAEDAVQEVFMRLYRELRAGHVVENPKAWAFVVLRHELGKRSADRFAGIAAQPLEVLDRLPAQHWNEETIDSERSELDKLLGVLTPREEQVFLLRLGALKYKEIAGELRISVKSVCTMLSRSLRKLQRAAQEPVGQEPIRQNVGTRASKTLQ
ncbi:MAG: RNA polymerase sigma factor [Acidobacteriia bacterium]|nr:RNA polymerase sigma factor [Terriglobia bacterium]